MSFPSVYGPHRYMAVVMDGSDLPRAWGISDRVEDAVAEARRQGAAYNEKHPDNQLDLYQMVRIHIVKA